MRLNFKNLKDTQTTAVAVEQERRLLLPCGEIALEMEEMVREGRLSSSGYGWVMTDMGIWIRVDYSREALGLPRV